MDLVEDSNRVYLAKGSRFSWFFEAVLLAVFHEHITSSRLGGLVSGIINGEK